MPEERRVVTLLFADVADSTAFGASNDPEDVRAVLGRYYEIAKGVVGAHGGTVEKFIGDAVMAIFGMPQAHGDDADRALAAALALREAVAEDPLTAALTLRMGVNTGEIVGSRGSAAGDFLVTGDAVNVAARLQQHARPGEILVGERTRNAAAAFTFGAVTTIEAKGKTGGLRAAPLAARSQATALGVRRATTPFVGRDADIAQLELLATRAFREERPQLVSVTAPAGTGKSRLIEEFLLRLPGIADRAAVAIAQCLPYGSAVTYLPLRGLMTGLLGTGEHELLFQRMQDVLREAGHEPADAARIATLVAATLGSSDEVEERAQDEFFGAWRVLIEAIAATRKLVLVFEDLHWASNSLLDLVDHVTLPRTRAPLLMIALGRPELLDRRPKWGAARRNFSALGLEPLTGDETTALVRALLPDAPEALRDRIVERSGGNAFFAGELARAYADSRAAGANDGEILLPDTVHATVLARLDTLPDAARRVLQQGAIGGRTFRPDAVAVLLPDMERQQIDDVLEELTDRQLIETQAPRTYTFAHIVIREVAYATLPRAERLRGHLRLAEWLERPEAGDTNAELVAYHYRQAMAAAGGGRLPEGLDVQRAVAAFERAAVAAKALGARAEAVELVRDAIRLAPASEHLRLYELMGDVSEWGDVATDSYAAAFASWQSLAEPQREALQGVRLLRKQLVVHSRWGGSVSRVIAPAELAEMLAQARALLAASPDEEEESRLAVIDSFQATSRALHGATDEARQRAAIMAVERSRDHFAARGDVNALSEALDALGSTYRSRGEFDLAIACARERLRHSDRLSLLERADAWNVIVWDLVWAGRYREAIRAADEEQASFRAGEPVEAATHGHAWAALGARLCGSWDDALRFCDLMRAWWEDRGRPESARFSLRGIYAAIHVARARLDGTRLAAYRSLAGSSANVAALPPGHPYAATHAILAAGASEGAAGVLADERASAEYKAEIIAFVVLEEGLMLDEAVLRSAERSTTPMISLLSERIALARAIRGSDRDLAAAVSRLDAADLGADGARAAALLALRRGDPEAIARARERLETLGDRLFIARLEEHGLAGEARVKRPLGDR
ncbi:MAG TPA: adenylate/guanylate cyclase domain-containing protein [Candidatus Limnocylindria bacterium]|nr:adenylate/guanylate cyclase domain-containing protein [Candidatus Limnocylindria bacterium]